MVGVLGGVTPAPLTGVRVLDLGSMLAAPLAARYLADLGATVIKLESPGGDRSRRMSPRTVGGESLYFLSTNRNKSSIAVDLRDPVGRTVAGRVIASVDVVIDSNPPGKGAPLGLDPHEHCAVLPRLIWASITGYGHEGSRRGEPTHDLLVQALSGVMALNGESDGDPVRVGVPVVGVSAALHAVIGVLAALRKRDTTGLGSFLDVSMLDAQVALTAYVAADAMYTGVDPVRQGSGHTAVAVHGLFTCRDGRAIVVVSDSELTWAGLCAAVGDPDLAADGRFASEPERLSHRPALTSVLESAFARRPADEWLATLAAHAVPAAPVRSVVEAVSEDVAEGGGLVATLEIGDDTVRSLASPVGLAAADSVPPSAAPGLGSGTRAVLADLGYSDDEIDELASAGAVSAGVTAPHTAPRLSDRADRQ